jgi:hypothetical protein
MDVVVAVAFVVSSCQQVRLSRQFELFFFFWFPITGSTGFEGVERFVNGMSRREFVLTPTGKLRNLPQAWICLTVRLVWGWYSGDATAAAVAQATFWTHTRSPLNSGLASFRVLSDLFLILIPLLIVVCCSTSTPAMSADMMKNLRSLSLGTT